MWRALRGPHADRLQQLPHPQAPNRWRPRCLVHSPSAAPAPAPDLDIIHAELRAKDIEWCQKIIENFKKMRQVGQGN